MVDTFLHGINIIEIDQGSRPIQTARSSVIGLIGTAPDANNDLFPINTPVLIAGKKTETKGLGNTGTLPHAINGIFDQVGALVVMIRVEQAATSEETLSNVMGGVNPDNGHYQGLEAFLSAQSTVKVTPRILIAPGLSHELAVANKLNTLAQRLRAIAIIEGPNSTDQAAIDVAHTLSSDRILLVDPAIKIWDTHTNQETITPNSPYIAGLIAKSDHEPGFWVSPSNQIINGILGTARPIDFTLGDPNSRANLLNENKVTTIIEQNGYRLWGNRSTTEDPKWSFISVRRTADIIHESLLQAHLWAVDKNITQTYLEDVIEGVNAYLRHLKTLGAIIDGQAFADPELNTKEQITQGKIAIDFDFTATYPAEKITFRSHLTDKYLTQILPNVA